jgi:TonB family protein
MNTDHSASRRTFEYQPTIIESRVLISRLAIQIAFLNQELKRSWTRFKHDPATFAKRSTRRLLRGSVRLISTPNAAAACLTAFVVVAGVVLFVLLIERTRSRTFAKTTDEQGAEVVLLDVSKTTVSKKTDSLGQARSGKDGAGRVGFQKGKGEGSGPTPKRSQGGGSGGDGNPAPPQVGKLPPPSSIQAAIPITAPIHPPALPVAGIDIDPALWKDLKAPVYGDPNSKSEVPSKGPGEGEGIGTNKGTGVGDGSGPGYGSGDKGNTGGGPNQQGCCGPSGGADDPGRPFIGREVEQRARLLSKPEPQYTEEARRNQITGTVKLRVVFSSAGEVVQIKAVNTLPFGLTERAIAAARQIKFVPASKGGRAVSVFMQLEYNFNLY